MVVWASVLALAILLPGCALNPTPEQLAAADFGPMPESYQQIIMTTFSQTLFDPYSAVYQFSAPSQGWSRTFNEFTYGWAVCGTLNAKNRFGGYVGATPFFVLIRHGQIMRRELGRYVTQDGFCR